MSVRRMRSAADVVARLGSIGLAMLALLLWLPSGSLPAAVDAEPAVAPRGAPLSLRFGPESLEALPNIFAVVGDDAGWLYAANLEGVLRFDGRRWQSIRMPGNASARALAVAADGRLFVGGEDNFGEFEVEPSGRLRYHDLRDAFGLVGVGREVGTVWQTLALPEGVYFHADAGLFLYAADGAHRRWPLPENLRSLYSDGARLYGRIAGTGLAEIRAGQAMPVPGGEVFAEQILAGMAVSRGRVVLVGGRGLYTLGEEGVRFMAVAPWDEATSRAAYEAVGLVDGSLLVGTLDGEVWRVDGDGVVLSRVDLGAGAIRALFRDRDGAVWVGADRGVLRLSVQLGWSFLGESHGIQGWLHDMEWHRGVLWLAGSRGLGRLRPSEDGMPRAEWLELFDLEAFDLLPSGNDLLVGHRNGVLRWRDERDWRELLSEADSVVDLVPFGGQSKRGVWAVGKYRLHVLWTEGGTWRQLASHPLEGLSVWGAREDGPGTLWLGDARGPPQRWRFDPDSGALIERERMDERFGLSLEPERGSAVKRFDSAIHVVSGQRVQRWDGERWEPGASEPFARFAEPMEVMLEAASDGLYAYDSASIWRRAGGEAEWRALHFDTVQGRGTTAIRDGSDGRLRIGTWLGLLQRDSLVEPPPPLPLSVRLLSAGLLSGRDEEPESPLPLVSRADAPVEVGLGHSLRLQFGLLGAEPGQEFRFRVNGDGPEDGWTVWSDDRVLFLRTTVPGAYRVDVQGRVRSGRPVEPLRLHFLAPTPWYRSVLGQALIGALGLLLIALAVRALILERTRRLAELNRSLEQRVLERTRDLEEANRKLGELAVEDALTGALNRRALDHGLQREWLRCHDSRQPLAVLMIDVDHFKRYNDERGHLEGDNMLCRIVDTLRARHDPDRELLARYGGEEFALILPGAHLDEAVRRAQAIRADLSELCPPITVSIGVAGCVPDRWRTPTGLLRKADTALYRAKHEGRDRVAVAED